MDGLCESSLSLCFALGDPGGSEDMVIYSRVGRAVSAEQFVSAEHFGKLLFFVLLFVYWLASLRIDCLCR